ncbi:MAG: carboxypeptidase regulatory-like domain-containing protein [Bacteroidia bacterium]
MRTLQLLSVFIFLMLFNVGITLAQSISGNVKDFASSSELAYANVDIYSGDELVASVLADKDGNFFVKLDSGTYRCEILYAGYHKVSQTFKVTDDEKANFNLKNDPSSAIPPPMEIVEDDADYSETTISSDEITKLPARSIDGVAVTSYKKRRLRAPRFGIGREMGASSAGDADGSPDVHYDWISPDLEETPQATSGLLTAGEINDFSKWDLWNDLTDGELKGYQQIWSLAPMNRYMVEVTTKEGLPLVNVRAELRTESNEVLFSARTDNTGKAELWSSIEPGSKLLKKLNIKLVHGEQVKVIKNAKVFGKGNNRSSFSADCEQTQVVDIAFVVDATGSMGDELEFLKAELNDVIFKSKEISSKLNYRFGNVFYRDQGDAYVTRTQNFSRVLTEATSFISRQRADGGGDFPEAVEVALDSAVNGLSWSEEARARLLFLVLDAPPHQNPAIQKQLQRISLQAAEKGIRIIPVTASGIDKATEYLMRSLALTTNGTYTFLTDHSGIGGSHIEPSTDSYDVELLNDLMVRLIKSYTYMPDCQQQIPELNLPYSDSVVIIPNIDSSEIVDSTITEDSLQTLQWKYYPNPTRGIVNVVASVAIKELHITDLSGKILQKITNIKEQETVQANLYGYPSGLYLIRYPVGNRWVSGKIVLMR